MSSQDPPTLPLGDSGAPSNSGTHGELDSHDTILHAPPGGRVGLHIRCPHCRNPIELLPDAPLESVRCASCGSEFSLTGEDGAATRDARGLAQVGHFKLVDRIGIGAFGTVWKAQDTELDRTVAVKIPRAGELDKLQQDMFLREARSAAQLRHPNIVPVYEVGREGETLYIVSEFVRGVTLADQITAGPLAAREAAELCAKIADALEHAHEHGVIHRDLKPGNVMIDGQGEPHLMDFGLARRETGEITMTLEGQVLGTPAYMSPEQAAGEGHVADRRSDVYSLGAMLFQFLTGEFPFRGNARMLIHQVIHDEPPSPRKLNREVPKDLETITLKCLEKEPTRRYQTARELADELRRYIANRPILARPITRLHRTWRWCKRNRAVAALTGGLVLALAVGAIVSTRYAIRATDLADRERAARAESESQQQKAEQNAALVRRQLYVANMNLTSRAWEANNVSVMRDLLEQTKPHVGEEDFRSFEWYYWNRLGHMDVMTLRESKFMVTSLAFSPSGSEVASASGDGAITLWDMDTGRRVKNFKGHANWAWSVEFSPDGKRLVSGAADGLIKIWDVATGQESMTLDGGAKEVTCVAFSADGKRLASGSFSGFKLWDVANGKEITVRNTPSERAFQVVFSPDGKRLASASAENDIKLWEVATGEEVLAMKGHTATVEDIAFSPDGRQLASGSVDNTIKLWDVKTGREIVTLRGHRNRVRSIAFRPDGKYLASASYDWTVKLWDVAAGEEIKTLKGHDSLVMAVAFSPDGRRLVTGSGGGTSSEDWTIKLWDVTLMDEPLRYVGHLAGVSSVAISPKGKWIASGSDDGALKLWDIATGRETKAFIGHEKAVRGVAFSPDGMYLASWCNDQPIKLWDVTTGQLALSLEGQNCAAFSPDGKFLVSGVRGHSIRFWDVRTGQESASLSGQSEQVVCLAFSPDGNQLASACADNSIELWDVAAQQQRLSFKAHNQLISCIAVSPDGQCLATGSYDRTARLWDMSTGQELMTFKGHSSGVTSVAFTRDGKRLATASSDPTKSATGTIKFWDLATGQETMTLDASDLSTDGIAFSPDGTLLASASSDGVIKLWEATRPTSSR